MYLPLNLRNWTLASKPQYGNEQSPYLEHKCVMREFPSLHHKTGTFPWHTSKVPLYDWQVVDFQGPQPGT